MLLNFVITRKVMNILTTWSLLLSFNILLAVFNSTSWLLSSFSRLSMRFLSSVISRFKSSAISSDFDVSNSWNLFFNRWFSSLYEWSCRFHSSTFAVDSCKNLYFYHIIKQLLDLIDIIVFNLIFKAKYQI